MAELDITDQLLCNRYRVLSKIGQGGIGSVYLALDTHIGRELALKVLSSEAEAQPDLPRRLENEIRILAKLGTHPHIVALIDRIVHEGKVILVMEYVPGETLASVLQRTKKSRRAAHRQATPMAAGIPGFSLDPASSVRIALQCLDALQFAHAKGILHRDIKPSNILITRDYRQEIQIKIADFGIAKAVFGLEDGLGTPFLTRPGSPGPGTPAYMAPEQFDPARFGSVGPGADLYGLGVTLYEMLTLALPFTGNLTELLHAHANIDPPDPCSLNPAIGKDLQRILIKALRKRQEDRYQSAEEFHADLMKVRIERAAPPKPQIDRTMDIARGPRRSPHGGLVFALGFLVAALLLALGGLAYYALPADTFSSLLPSAKVAGPEPQTPPKLPEEPPKPLEPVPAPRPVEPTVSKAEADEAKARADGAKTAAEQAGAKQYAAAALEDGDKHLKTADSHLGSGDYEKAVPEFQEAEKQFRDARTVAQRVSAVEAQVAKAKSAADAVNASTLAPGTYEKAAVAQRSAADVPDAGEKELKLAQAKLLYDSAREEAVAQSTSVVDGAKRDAKAARDRANTNAVKRYASKEWSAAEALMAEAEAAGTEQARAKTAYEQATLKYGEAATEAEKREQGLRASWQEAKESAGAAWRGIGERERTAAPAQVSKGEKALSEAALLADEDRTKAIALYGTARKCFLEAIEAAKKPPPPPASTGPLRVEPAKVTLTAEAPGAKLHVLQGDTAVPSDQVTAINMQGTGDMLEVRNADSSDPPGTFYVALKPGKAQVGKYKLSVVVKEERQEVEVEVVASPPSSEKPPDVTTGAGGEVVQDGRLILTLPPQYTEGQILRIPGPESPNAYYIWKVNGKVVSEGYGKSDLACALSELGPCRVEEMEKDSPSSTRCRKGSAETTVVAEPEQHWDTIAGMAVPLQASTEAYGKYEWRVDGKVVSQDPAFNLPFAVPGTYRLECKMSEPKVGAERAFRRIVWNTTVRAPASR